MHDKMIIHKPSAGFPNANKPNRSTHASMLNSITYLMPNLRRKKGMVRINNVSDVCEIANMLNGNFTAHVFWKAVIFLKSLRKSPPYIFVSCNAAPRNMEKAKNIANFGVLNKLNALKPNTSTSDFFSALFNSGRHLGKVNEYKPNAKATADA